MLSFLAETLIQPPDPAVWPTVPGWAEPSVPVVLRNVPSNLNVRNPDKQREFEEKLGCAGEVQHTVAKQDKVVVYTSDKQ